MFGKYRVRLLQIFFVVEHSVGEGFGVLGNALGMILANFFRQIARVAGGGRDRQRRIRWVDIYRRNVKLEARMRLLEKEAADSPHVADDWHQLKFHRHPSAPLAFVQDKMLVLKAD